MKMRWPVLLLIAALLAPAGALAQGGKRTIPAGSTKPVIEILVTSHDFGEVYKQDNFRHAFTVHNRGNADLVIEEVKPG